jgi:hypothetical protein
MPLTLPTTPAFNMLRADSAIVQAIGPVTDDIYQAYRMAWIECRRKMGAYVAERRAWDRHRIFAIGGGSLVSATMEIARVHPGLGTRPEFAALDPPEDLLRTDKTGLIWVNSECGSTPMICIRNVGVIEVQWWLYENVSIFVSRSDSHRACCFRLGPNPTRSLNLLRIYTR